MRHRSLLLFDIEKYGQESRADRTRLRLREVLRELGNAALATAGISPEHVGDAGDGFLYVLNDVDKVALLRSVMGAFTDGLLDYNRMSSEPFRMRVRVVIHAGEVSLDDTGTAVGAEVNLAFRILDDQALRAELDASPAPLVLAVSEYIFQKVVRQQHPGLYQESFQPLRISVKETSTRAWVWTPPMFTAVPARGQGALAELRRDAAGRPVERPDIPPPPAGRVIGIPRAVGPVVDRPQVFKRIQTEVIAAAEASRGQGQIVGITGMPGAGKTVLARRIAHDPLVARAFPDGVVGVEVGPRPNLLTRQISLLEALGEPPLSLVDEVQGRVRLERSLAGKRCLLVIDNVWHAADLSAFPLPDGCVLLVVTRDTSVLPRAARICPVGMFSDEEALQVLAAWAGQEKAAHPEELPPTARQIIRECGNLPLAVAVAGAQATQDPVPRWKHVLDRLHNVELDQLKVLFGHEYQYPSLLKALAASVEDLSREQQECYWALAAFAGHGLIPEPIVVRLWACSQQLPEADGRDLVRLFERRSLIVRDHEGRLTLHDLLFDYTLRALGRQDEGRLRRLHAELSQSLLHRWGGLEGGLGALHARATFDVEDHYALNHLVRHLVKAGRDEHVHRLLRTESSPAAGRRHAQGRTENVWYLAHDRAGLMHAYLADLGRGRRIAERATEEHYAATEEHATPRPAPSIGLELRYALIAASLNSLVANLPSVLLVTLVEQKTWTAAQALAHVQRIPDEATRLDAFTRLLPVIPAHEHALVRPQATAIAAAFTEPRWRAEALVAVAAGLASAERPDIVAKALATARQVVPLELRAETFSRLAWYLSAAEQQQVAAEALAILRKCADDARRWELLAGLAPWLDGAALQEAVANARRATDPDARAQALSVFASRLPAQDRQRAFDDALAAARLIEHPVRRAQALEAVVLRLAGSTPPQAAAQRADARAQALESVAPWLRSSATRQALDTAREIGDPAARFRALEALAPKLPAPDRQRVAAEALSAARAIEDPGQKVQALRTLASILPPPEHEGAVSEALVIARTTRRPDRRARAVEAVAPWLQGATMREALEAARTITDPGPRAQALTALAAQLPAAERQQVTDEALEAARTITDPGPRAQALTALAAHLPAAERQRFTAHALAAACSIERLEQRVEVLTSMTSLLAGSERRDVLAETLNAVQGMRYPWVRTRVLEAVGPHLDADSAASALTLAGGIDHPWWRTGVIEAIAPHLDDSLAWQALELVADISQPDLRVRLFVALAPRLSSSKRQDAATEALAAADAIIDPDLRVRMLEALDEYVPAPDRARIHSDAIAAARAIASPGKLAAVLLRLAHAVAPAHRNQFAAEALAAGRQIDNPGIRAEILVQIAPRLERVEQAQVLGEALAAARRVTQPSLRAQLLARIIHQLEPGRRQPVVGEALAAARILGDVVKRAEITSSLAPWLDARAVREAFAAARRADNPEARAWALLALIGPTTAPDTHGVLAEMLASALAIPEPSRRARTLRVLCLRAPDTMRLRWNRHWRTLATTASTRPRQEFLTQLAAIAPVVDTAGGEDAVREVIQAVVDVQNWWP